MMRITKLKSAGGSADYYGTDDYYVDGETDGPNLIVGGKGAEYLGLSGPLDRETFIALLNGINPDGDGEAWSREDARLKGQDLAARPDDFDEDLEQDEPGAPDPDVPLPEEVNVDKEHADEPEKPNSGWTELKKDDPAARDRAITQDEGVIETDKYEKSSRAKHAPGWDVTFNAPKRLSMAGLIFDDEAAREIHDLAATKTMAFLEEHYAISRNRVDGEIKDNLTGNLVWAKVPHELSRAGDPHLHHHFIVFNMTRTEDGNWQALETKMMYDYQKLGTMIYHANLRELALDRGKDMRDHGKEGQVDFDAWTQTEQLPFSTRTEDIERHKVEFIATNGRMPTGAEENEILKKIDRQDKLDKPRAEVKAEWAEKAEKYNITDEPLNKMTGRNRTFEKEGQTSALHDLIAKFFPSNTDHIYRDVEAAMDYGLKHAASKQAVFTVSDALMATMSVTRGNITVDELLNSKRLNAPDVLKADKEIIGGITTKEALATEQAVLDHILDNRGTASAYSQQQIASLLTPDRMSKILGKEGATLNAGQMEAVFNSLGSPDGIVSVHGLAGTGKTSGVYKTMADLARDLDGPQANVMVAFQTEAERRSVLAGSVEMRGVAPTHTAAQELRKSGVETTTIAAMLRDYEKSLQAPDAEKLAFAGKWKGTILIIDEANMVDNPTLKRLFDMKRDLQIDRIIVSGDINQLSSMGPGAPYYMAIQAHLDNAKLDDIKRQKDPMLRNAVYQMSLGNYGQAFSSLGNNVKEVGGERDGLVERLAERAFNEWKELKAKADADREAGKGDRTVVVISDTNAMRGTLNELIRGELKRTGEIGPVGYQQDVLRVKGIDNVQRTVSSALEAGDTIQFFSNVRRLKISSGDTFEVTGLNHQSQRVHAQREDGKIGHFQLSAAMYKDRPTFAIYRKDTLEIAEGDRMIWGKTDEKRGIANHDAFQVVKIDANSITIFEEKTKKERVVQKDDELLRHVSHGQALNANLAEGQTYGDAVAVMMSQGHKHFVTATRLDVLISRQEYALKVITDSASNLLRQISENIGINRIAINHITDDYERSRGELDAQKRIDHEKLKSADKSKDPLMGSNELETSSKPGQAITSYDLPRAGRAPKKDDQTRTIQREIKM